MTHNPQRRLRPGILAWLVWLALLLPTVQWAVAMHQVSQLHAASGLGEQQPLLSHSPACDACLAAAALASGALPAERRRWTLAPGQTGSPPKVTLGAWISAPPNAYLSRAPPPSRG